MIVKARLDSEAHRRLKSVAPRYRNFALIAHLRADHGLSEVMPERASGAHALFTMHERVLTMPRMSCRRCRYPTPARRPLTARFPGEDAR
jgi:hypothetical protein